MKKIKVIVVTLGMFFCTNNLMAICLTPSFKITSSTSSSTQCFIITEGYTSRLACTVDQSGTQTLAAYLGTSNLLTDECGLHVTTNVCYTIRPIDWVNGNQIFTIKFLSSATWNNNFAINYNQATHQFTVTSPGNTSAYEIGACRACEVDKVIASNANFAEPLTESSTWIQTTENLTGNSVVISPTAQVKFDANPTNGYVRLKSGFYTKPTTGFFMAQCVDGCGPEIPGAKKVNMKLLIEGYANGGSSMKPVLMNQGIGMDSSVTDWVNVELHSQSSPYNIVSSTDAKLKVTGLSEASFPPTLSGAYYIAIKHRNAVQTWSSNPVSIDSSSTFYDFTNSNSKAYGSNQVEVSPGIWAFYSGDVMSDENIDLLDLNLVEGGISNFEFGYTASDINGDGNVDLLDAPIVEGNINNFIFSNHP